MLHEIILTGQRAQLEPLEMSHCDDLWQAAQNPEIFTYFPHPMATRDDMVRFIALSFSAESRGEQLPFAVRDLESGRIVGSTRFMDFSAPNCSTEIGATWLSSAVWRTRINTECKYLLLKHGFETLSLVRIYFKTDTRNARSQRAIERLGAQKEGVLRSHLLLPDGFRRDSVFYSILDREWPAIKAKLEGFLSK